MNEEIKNVTGFKDCLVYLEGEGIKKASLSIINGKITSVKQAPADALHFEEDLIIVPGFVNRHVHGAKESDSMYPNANDLKNIALTMASEGTTSFLATTMTQTIGNIDLALENINDYIKARHPEGAEVLGVHLEGPFISKKHKGAQPETCIIPGDVEQFKKFQKISGNHIRQVTLAYEENGKKLVEYLVSKGIVASIGHSDATAADFREAANYGVTSLTHSYNAMRPIHHREVGALGAAMLDDRIYAEIIADLIHVSKEAIQILYRMKGKEKITLITDSLEASHMSDGVYQLGGQKVYVAGKEARLESGALAGSTLWMNNAVKNIIEVLGITLEEAVDMATINPARCLKIEDRKGSIAVGKDADFAIIDKDLNVHYTIRGGKIVYQKTK